MADRVPLKAIYSGADPVALGEFEAGDTFLSTYASYDPTGNTHITSANVQLALDDVEAVLVTDAAHIADLTVHRVINDAGTSATELWSANKINAHAIDATIHRQINDGGTGVTDLWSASKIDSHTSDATLHRIINDAGSATDELWSSNKISTHTTDATIHRSINDGGTGVTDLWSASKITAELGTSSNPSAFTFQFSTLTTELDPGSNTFRYNNATPASVTELYFDDLAGSGVDISSVFALLNSDHVLLIKQSGDPTKFLMGTVGTVVDNTGWWSVGITILDSGTLPDAAEKCSIEILNMANKAVTSNPLLFNFNTSTSDADPGDYQFAIDTADTSTFTEIYLDDKALNDIWINNMVQGLGIKTYVIIQQLNDPANKHWSGFVTATPVNKTGYTLIPVGDTDGDGGTLFDSGAVCSITFIHVKDLMASSQPTWKFDTATTSTEPAAGYFKLNSATPGAATRLYIDDLCSAGWAARDDVLVPQVSTTNSNFYIYVQQLNDPAKYILFDCTTAQDESAWSFESGDISQGTLFDADAECSMTVIPLNIASTTGFSMSGTLNLLDNALTKPKLDDAAETFNDSGLSGAGTITFNYGLAMNFELDITGNCTFAFSNWPPTGTYGCMVLWLYDGGDFSPTWPTIKWANNTAPALSSNLWDKIVIETRDAGTTLMGTHAGVGYPV
jgi:hypothetical protein